LASLPHILGLLVKKSIPKIEFVKPDTLNWGSTVYKIRGKIIVMHRNKTLVLFKVSHSPTDALFITL
jgi:hypothetical protein